MRLEINEFAPLIAMRFELCTLTVSLMLVSVIASCSTLTNDQRAERQQPLQDIEWKGIESALAERRHERIDADPEADEGDYGVQEVRTAERIGESLDAALLSGRPFVMLDNWRGKFESSHLEAILTAPGSVSVRVPFKAGVPVDPEWFIVGMTSNGVETTRDLANRSSIVRIRKQPPGFQFRRFPEGDLYDHVRANQPYYLGCVFSVILEWIQAGKPRTEETRHAARPWCQILDWIVQNIFGEAPLMDGHEGAQTRVANPALTFARNIALAASQRGQLGIPVTASNLYDLALECDLGVPSLQKPDDKAGPKLVGAAMAKVFGAANEIEVEGIRISRGSQKVPREDGQGSYEMKIYTFTVNKHQPA